MENGHGNIYYAGGAFLVGAVLLSLLAIPPKIILGADPFALKGFIVPFLFGGLAGMLLGLAYRMLKKENLELKRLHEAFRERDLQYKAYFDNQHAAMMLINAETADIVDANPAACAFYGYDRDQITRLKITDINTLSEDDALHEMELARNQNRQYFNFKHRLANGNLRDVEVYSGPIQFKDQDLLYSVIHDVTERRQAEDEREQLIAGLQQALTEIKTLSGLLPICANCKKIRDDKGYWKQIEDYIGEHSDAQFSHSICPQCMSKLYPEVEDN